MTRLTTRTLTRTLWVRQQLVPGSRTVTGTADMVEHLVGLQAQDTLPPYLSLAARLPDFDPTDLSDLLETRELVRFLTLRGTVHVLTPDDALALRPWVQPALDRISASNAQNRPAAHLTSQALDEAARAVLAGASMPLPDLASRLADAFPDVPEDVLRRVARERLPLLQAPPRGQWKRSGGVVYAFADDWLGRHLAEADPRELVRRYLAAYGPASAADMSKWSTVTRLGPVFAAMHRAGELVTYADESGRTLYDVPGGVIAEDDLPLPIVMLGAYDNLFLSHADRDRIAPDPVRRRWMGSNGAIGCTLFVDGLLAGTWRHDGSRFEVDVFGSLTRAERNDLHRAQDRIAALLAR